MRLWTIGLLVGMLALGCGRSRAERRTDNAAYMKNVVGDVILKYKVSRGTVPFVFGEALAVYPKQLSHRGDLYGQPYGYERLGPSSFYLHCFGENGKDDGGKGDDMVLVWTEGQGWQEVAGLPTEQQP